MRKLLRSAHPARVTAVAAFLALAAVAQAAASLVPPPSVTVTPKTVQNERVKVPIRFDAPFVTALLAPNVSHYLRDAGGRLIACQIKPLAAPQADLGYRWATVEAVAPIVADTYTLVSRREELRPAVPLVAALSVRDKTILETGAVSLVFDPSRFTVFQSVKAGGWQAVPDYSEDLLNVQQGVSLVVTDKFRHADFELAHVASSGFKLEAGGPAEARVAYEGAFAGRESVGSIPFTARVSLYAENIVAVAFEFDDATFDGTLFELKSVRITLPLMFLRGTRVAFGGPADSLSGLERWRGSSHFSLSPGGSYTFQDVEGSPVSGAGPITWCSYGDEKAAAVFFWEADAEPVEFTASDYSQDLVMLSLTPRARTEGSLEAKVYMHFTLGRGDPALATTRAEGLRHPPAAAVDQTYMKAVTLAK